MTISTTASSVRAQGNGAQTVFSYSFPIPSGAGYTLYLVDALGNITTLDPSVYSINGIGSANGGSFTYPLAGGTPVAAGEWLVLARNVPDQQNTALSNQGPYLPQVVELGLDWLEMQIQQNSNELTQTLRAPPADVAMNPLPMAVARANQYLAFSAAGQPIVTTGPSSGAAVSAAMAPVVEAATLDAGRVAFGAGATGATLFQEATFPAAEGDWAQGLASASAPPSPKTYQRWWDTSTTPNTLRLYDGAQWLAIGTVDTSGHAWQATQPLVSGISSNYTLTAADNGKTFASGAANLTATLPLLSSVPDGYEAGFQAQNVTFTIAANATDANKIYGPNNWGVSSVALSVQGDEIRFKKQGTTGWLVINRAYALASTADAQAGTNGAIAMTPYAFAGAVFASPNQSWSDKTPSRALGTVYTNSTGRPIMVLAGVYNTSGGELQVTVGGVTMGYAGGTTGIRDIISFVVKKSDTYELSVNFGSFSLTSWLELS